jgi:hypothetical protein
MTTFAEKLLSVMADVSYLQKKGKNEHFKYSFVQEAQVKEAVSAALRKHGLFLDEVTYAPLGDAAGKACTLVCQVVISDDEGRKVRYCGVGAGTDSGDKAPMKACAAALKYALTSGFLIATGDDPEADAKTDEPRGSAPGVYGGKGLVLRNEVADGEGPVFRNLNEALMWIDGCAAADELTSSEAKAALSAVRPALNPAQYDELTAHYRARRKELTK